MNQYLADHKKSRGDLAQQNRSDALSLTKTRMAFLARQCGSKIAKSVFGLKSIHISLPLEFGRADRSCQQLHAARAALYKTCLRSYSAASPEKPRPESEPPRQKTTLEKINKTISKENRQKMFANTKERTSKVVKEALDKIPTPKAPVFRENVYTVPNVLTMTRLVAAPVVGYLVLKSDHITAAWVFLYACATDWLDGYIARKYELQSVVGSVIDPMADKMLMVTLTGCLAWIGSLPSK